MSKKKSTEGDQQNANQITNTGVKKVGDILYFNELECKRIIETAKNKIIPALIEVQTRYNELNIGEFGPDHLQDVYKFDTRNIGAKFREEVVKAAKQVGPLLAGLVVSDESIEAKLKPFSDAVQSLHSVFNSATNKNLSAAPNMDLRLHDIFLEDGKFLLNEADITARNQIRIENEKQLEFYNLQLTLKEAYDALRQYMRNNLHHRNLQEMCIIDSVGNSQSLCWENEDRTLFIDPKNMELV